MKRLVYGLFAALIIGLIASVGSAYAAPGGGRGPGNGVGGKVASVSGTTISVTTRDGTATIATTSSTTFKVNGASASLSDVAVGMFMHAEGSRASDGTFTATNIIASTSAPTGDPHQGHPNGGGAAGKVTAISGLIISVATPRGTAAITTTASTTFQVNGTSASLSDVAVGMFVHADMTRGTDGSLTATRVVASTSAPSGQPPRGHGPGANGIGGQVASVSGTTISVTTRDGTATIATTSSTTFKVNGASASLSAITVGLYLHAEGTRASDGTFTATSVVASTTRPTPPSHH